MHAQSTIKTAVLIGLASAFLTLSGGCAANGGKEDAGTPSSEDSLTAARIDDTPIHGNTAVLTVYGMSCPLCANNIDKALLKVRGVTRVHVDMATGKATVDLDGKTPVTRRQLASAVDQSGFSLQRVDVP